MHHKILFAVHNWRKLLLHTFIKISACLKMPWLDAYSQFSHQTFAPGKYRNIRDRRWSVPVATSTFLDSQSLRSAGLTSLQCFTLKHWTTHLISKYGCPESNCLIVVLLKFMHAWKYAWKHLCTYLEPTGLVFCCTAQICYHAFVFFKESHLNEKEQKYLT